jgi:hypothetical protein
MDGEKFDDLLKKVCTTRLTRLGVFRGLAVAAVATVTGSAFVSDDAVAGKKSKKARKKKRAARERHLGDACKPGNPPGSNVQGNCADNEDLECQFVGQTGASRCECTTGFTACDGVCVQTGANGPIGCQAVSACECACPSTAPDTCIVDNTDPEVAVCVDETCGGDPNFTFNPATCQCEQGCPEGQVFCNGCCFNPNTVCTRRNQNFNAECCSCENPGQPSNNCKNPPLECPAPA